MRLVHRSSVVVGIVMLLGGLAPAVQATPAPAAVVPVATGRTQLIGVNANVGGISGDGRFVLYSSPAETVQGDGRLGQVYLRDTRSGVVSRISRSVAGAPGNAASVALDLSADGRYAVYRSAATNLPGATSGTGTLLYRYDRTTGRTAPISRAGAVVRAESFSAAISATGRYLAYTPTGDRRDVYRFDATTGQTLLVNQARGGGLSDGSSFVDSVSSDGHVTYGSSASTIDPVPGLGTSQLNIYLWDPTTRASTLVTRAAGGGAAGGGGIEAGSSDSEISTDGRFITFQSIAGDLVTAGRAPYTEYKVFTYNVATRRISRIPTPLDADAGGRWDYVPSISGDGRYVTYSSITPPETSADPRFAVVRYDRKTLATEILVATPSLDPRMSDDGRHVVYTGGPDFQTIQDAYLWSAS